MAVPPPSEAARRVRAAFAYAGLDISKEHPELGISKATVARIVSASKPRGANQEELERIAAFTKVPLAFLAEGWPDESPSAAERLERVEHLYATLNGRLEQEAERRRETLTELSSDIRRLEQALAESTRTGRRQRGTEGRR